LIFAGLSTLTHTIGGIIINDVIVNRWLLETYLLRLPNQTKESVALLLNPEDPQDVPRAIELIQALADLRNLEIDLDPAELKTLIAIKLMGHLFNCLIQPYIDPTLSLTQQIEYLSEFQHVAMVLYRKNSTAFFPGQLYGDTSVTIKSAVFYI
jgi:hypothetical protein